MVEKLILQNGVRLLYEHLEGVRSCAVGVWVENGSCHEPAHLSGMSHFIEHMLFKGTETRSASDLAEAFDAIGGQVNAFTTKEHTCFYARTLDVHLQTAAELLYDMVHRSVFAPQELELERGVVLEEIGMYEDTPEELAADLLAAACFPGQPLGRPILGREETLNTIDHDAMLAYFQSRYVGSNLLITLAGSFTEDDLQAVGRLFSAIPAGDRAVFPDAVYHPAATEKEKSIEQNHLLMVFPAFPAADPRRYALAVLNNILGAGMSSRLFQRVREQAGLCYSIYSYTTLYANTGVLGIYTALSRDTQRDALRLIREELLRLKETGVTEAELSRTKDLLKTSLLLGMEGSSARMNAIARSEMVYGCQHAPEETAAALDAVTAEQVLALAREVLDFSAVSFAAVGKDPSSAASLALLRGNEEA